MTKAIEVIYDRLIAEEKLKAGTKYEKLAAIAFKSLSGSATVHDLRLRGAIGVPHQIDVVVGDEQKRILIEVKDYDRKIDLSVVRDFSAVVDDLKPAEAFVVSSVGFTEHAITWANAKKIRLAVLRPPVDAEDWGNLVRRVSIELRMSVPLEPEVSWHIHESEFDRFANANTTLGTRAVDDLTIHGAGLDPEPFRKFLDPQLQSPSRETDDAGERITHGKLAFEGESWLNIPGESPIRVTGFSWTQRWGEIIEEIAVGDGIGGLAAELVLRTADGSLHRMFTNREIQTWTFRDGHVVPS